MTANLFTPSRMCLRSNPTPSATGRKRIMTAGLVGAIVLSLGLVSEVTAAENHQPTISGYYKVSFSGDSLFPTTAGKEWFFDFGKGMQEGKTSGTVAVSVRQNPRVQVRLFAWQYDAASGVLTLGNPTEEGSRKAVVRAQFEVVGNSQTMKLERGDSYSILTRAYSGE